jgi:hypothetical protein
LLGFVGSKKLARIRQGPTKNRQDFLQAFNTTTRKECSITTRLAGFEAKNL